jgi:hypothetical protein
MLKSILESPEIMNAIISLVALVITAVVSILSIKVHAYLETLKNDKIRSVVVNSYDHLSKVAEDAVLYVKQTLVDDLKKNGCLSSDAMELVMEAAKSYIFQNTALAVLEVMEEEFGDLDDVVRSLIEAKVGKLKK